MQPEVGRAENSITLSRFKDSVAWHINIGFEGQDEQEVEARIDAIHQRMKQRYAPEQAPQLEASIAAKEQKAMIEANIAAFARPPKEQKA